MLLTAQPVSIVNTILWGNEDFSGLASNLRATAEYPVVTHCVVKGDFPGEGNIDMDPALVDIAGGDYEDRLRVLRAVAQRQGRLGVCSRLGLPQTDRVLLRHGLKKPPRRSRVPLRLYGSWIAARASRPLHTDAPAGRSRGGRRRATDEIAAAMDVRRGAGRKSACVSLRRYDSMAPH